MAIDLDKIQDSEYLMELLIQLEDTLDSLDIYVYRNWIKGEIVEGPIVRRHNVGFSLLYKKDQMPDPRGAARLMKHNLTVKFSKVSDHDLGRTKSSDKSRDLDEDQTSDQKDKKKSEHQYWLVEITVPRRLLDQMSSSVDLSVYDDEVDTDEVQAAKDSGLTDTSAYEQPDAGGEAPMDDPMAPPPEPGAPQ